MRVQVAVALSLGLCIALLPEGANAALVISKASTSNVNCAGGVCTATAADAVLNVKDLKGILQHGPLTIVSGSDAQDIEIDAMFKWTERHHLTLDAFHSIIFNQAVISEARSAVTLITNDGGTGGDYSFIGKGHLSFWDTKSELVINGQAFTLVTDIKTLASDIAANPSGLYALMRGYDASADGPYTSSPVLTTFEGSFEGLGHSVDNLRVSMDGGAQSQPCTGFLAEIGSSGTVRDIRITLANVTSSLGRRQIGVLAGCNNGSIVNASSDGNVQSARLSDIGGLVGQNAGTISNSGSAASASGDNSIDNKGLELVGGLVGLNSGTIAGSWASGSVTGASGSSVGGLVGWMYSGSITASHATGAVKNGGVCCGGNVHAGGLVGVGGNIAQSYATGTVDGGSGSQGEGGEHYAYAGGLIGAGDNITDSYATGAVTASDYFTVVGGLAGSSSAMTTSYSTGNVVGEEMGGLVGTTGPESLQHTDWDLDTSGISDPSKGAGNIANAPGVKGLTDAQLKVRLPKGFDPNIWGQNPNINNGYPYLLANPPPQ